MADNKTSQAIVDKFFEDFDCHEDGNYDERDISKYFTEALDSYRKKVIKECIGIIQTHDEGDGSYCDTGEDMEWGCRSTCVEKAVQRLLSSLK